MEKYQLYYQPKKNTSDIKSLSISYYDIDDKTCTFRMKIVLERADGKYKIKKYLGSMGSILRWRNVDISALPQTDADKEQAYFYIKTASHDYMTNNKDDITEILNIVNFDTILKYDISEYTKER